METNWHQKEILSFLTRNGFNLRGYHEGYFWVYKHPTKYPQFQGECDYFQVDYSLTHYTSLVDGYVEEETPESFVDNFLKYTKQGK